MTGAVSPHRLIRASAGSGKTFQLTNRFLHRLRAGAVPDYILATTFTRKAAGEILQRIWTRLADAALDGDQCRALAKHLGDDSLDAPGCAEILARLVGMLHRLQVGTLDSFFGKLATHHCFELGLPAGWRIVDDADDRRMRSEALQAVLRREVDQVLALTQSLFKGETTKSVAGQMLGLINRFYPLFLEARPEAWRSEIPSELPRERLESALAALAAIPIPRTAQGEPDKRWTQTLEEHQQQIQDGDWESFICKGIAAAVLKENDSFQRKPITAETRKVFAELLTHARAMLLAPLARQTQATFDLLSRFDAEYRQRKREQRGYRFEDITAVLAGHSWEGRLDAMRFRMDGRIDDLLLDEFQDTSPAQWRILETMARQITSEAQSARTFFCVGDGKQAIYGWRGGVAEILEELPKLLPGLESLPLSKSFRSAQPIIDAVNEVFLGLAANPVLNENYGDSASRWAAGFEEHSTAKTELPGYVRMVVSPADAESEKPIPSNSPAHWRFAALEVRRLAEEAPRCSVGVLVRTNYAVGRMVYELRRLGVEASEEGGVALTDSPAVTAILAALQLADHPGHSVAWFHVAHSPLGKQLQIRDGAAPEEIQAKSLEIRRQLLADGYGPTVSRWAVGIRDACGDRDASRLQRLVDLALAYEPRATLRPTDFVEWVGMKHLEDPSAARIRVMTAHQAKGLEFDIVVLPELDKRLLGIPPLLVGHRPSATAPIDRLCRYVNEATRRLLPPELQAVFEQDEDRRLREALCVLYVKMTRAIHALHMIIAPGREKEKTLPSTFAGILRGALKPGTGAVARTTLREFGDPNWFATLPKPEAEEDVDSLQAEPEIRLATQPSGRPRRLLRQSPSSMEGGAKVELAHRLRLEAAPAMDRGTLMHAWFEAIEWLDDGEPAESELRRIATEKGLGHLDLPKQIAQFQSAIRRPAVRQALTRPPGEVEAHREWPIAIIENDALITGAIDRLVLHRQGGSVIRLMVLDFKTDAVGPGSSELQARVEFYRPQLEAYRRAAAKQFRMEEKAVAAKLIFVEAGEVVEV